MKKEQLAPGIIVYSDVIENMQGLHIDIEEGLSSIKMSWIDSYVKTGDSESVDKEIRNTSSFLIPYHGKLMEEKEVYSSKIELFYTNLHNLFFESFDRSEKDYNQEFRQSLSWHDGYQILKYGPGGKFTNHIDDHTDYHRRVSTVYYLNDNYTGGEINFPRFGITFKPKANQMIIFPSTYVYNHSVSPVTEGERYAVASWLR
jgi:Rps23 Pro-64 3,4-dihydroxylase Tpa1-like proline 4-hydroxylase